jgi:hypothetical protein
MAAEADPRSVSGDDRPVKAHARAIGLAPGAPILTEQLATAGKQRIVVLAGPAGSGKTTLLTTVFDAFHEGPFAGYTFAGSRTLPAFEERCHENRLESDLDVANTPRNSRAQVGDFLNLRIATGAKAHVNLMLNDISGEWFRDLVDRPGSAAAMKAIGVATRIGIIVDGAGLLRPGERDQTAYEAETIARSIVDYAQVTRDLVIDVILTKLDLIMENEVPGDYVEKTLTRLANVAPPLHRGEVVKTAARPTGHGRIGPRTGVDHLLELWVGVKAGQLLTTGAATRPRSETA